MLFGFDTVIVQERASAGVVINHLRDGYSWRKAVLKVTSSDELPIRWALEIVPVGSVPGE